MARIESSQTGGSFGLLNKRGQVVLALHDYYQPAPPVNARDFALDQHVVASFVQRGMLQMMSGDGFHYDPAEFADPHQGDVDISLIEFNLRRTPRERLENHERMAASIRELREAGIRHYGFDPRPTEIAG